ncbi:MAG TPA: molybdopterin-binding protein [Pseudolabrys sp.]|nr:molybdopterin-binding protein [Pseudolabrys sp.]
MVEAPHTTQTISRLTPLAEIIAAIDETAKPVPARDIKLAAASGRVLAADIVQGVPLPSASVALQDGWAVAAETTRDAGGYAPALLPQVPACIEAGQPMPTGADAVAPRGTIQVRGGRAEALAPIGQGDGVLKAGGDSSPRTVLAHAGAPLRDIDIAVLSAAQIEDVSIREPRLRIVAAREDRFLAAAARLIANAADRAGCAAHIKGDCDIDAALSEASADAIIVIGGTGNGNGDRSVEAVARRGHVIVHGIALSPGETAAFGMAGSRPILMVSGRLDAAAAVWLTLGRHLMARLAVANESGQTTAATLTRKISSTVSLTELVPVRRDGDKAEPLATKYLPLSALAMANGYILVPAESEGYQAGSIVSVRPWL